MLLQIEDRAERSLVARKRQRSLNRALRSSGSIRRRFALYPRRIEATMSGTSRRNPVHFQKLRLWVTAVTNTGWISRPPKKPPSNVQGQVAERHDKSSMRRR